MDRDRDYATATESIQSEPFSRASARRAGELDAELMKEIDRLDKRINQLTAERDELQRIRGSRISEWSGPQPATSGNYNQR